MRYKTGSSTFDGEDPQEKAQNAEVVTVADTVAEQTLSDPGYGESEKKNEPCNARQSRLTRDR